MLCSEIMKFDVECVSPQTTVRDAARKMRDQNVGFLPVCDAAMHAVGTMSERHSGSEPPDQSRVPNRRQLQLWS